MSAPADVLVPDAETAVALEKVLREVHSSEGWRRFGQILLLITPWLLTVAFAVFSGWCLMIVWQRPIPQDRIYIALIHSDFGYEAPTLRENLTQTRQDALIKYSVQKFVEAWEGYMWSGNPEYYQRVSTMTMGTPLQKRYQDSWNDPASAEYRDRVYGQAVVRGLVGLDVSLSRAAPKSFEATALIRTRKGAEPAVCSYWGIVGTFRPDPAMPIEKQLSIDPSGLVFDAYESHEIKTIEAKSC